jgi:hypothetical protein
MEAFLRKTAAEAALPITRETESSFSTHPATHPPFTDHDVLLSTSHAHRQPLLSGRRSELLQKRTSAQEGAQLQVLRDGRPEGRRKAELEAKW